MGTATPPPEQPAAGEAAPGPGPAAGPGPAGAQAADAAPEVLLSARGVQVRYRGRPPVLALDTVDLDLAVGEVVALCGPNGAGKTTLLDAAAGSVRPTAGELTVLGRAPHRLDADGRAAVGVALADLGLPPAARARHVLEHHAGLHRDPHEPRALADRLDLTDHWHRSVRRLSSGQRQRLAIAVAVVGRPRLLLLDEPTAALDPAGRVEVLRLLRECVADGAGVLWSSHTLSDVERAADRVVVLHRGRVLLDGPPTAVAGGDVVRFAAPVALPLASLRTALPPTVQVAEVTPGHYEVWGPDVSGDSGPRVLATVAAWQSAQGAAGGLSLGPRALEDLVLELSTRERAR